MSARSATHALEGGREYLEMDMRFIPKILIALGFLSLSGCVVAPVGAPPGVYVGPQVVVPYVAVSPYYYGWYGPHYYYGRRW
jgi:hypothetical protein